MAALTTKEAWDLYQAAAARDAFSDETRKAHAVYAAALTRARKKARAAREAQS